MTALTFKPVTMKTLDDFTGLFEAKGGPSYCWCMGWRASKQEKQDTSHPALKRQMLGRIENHVPVGLLGYDGGTPVAWVSIAPRQTYRKLGGPEDDDAENVWSLACMFVQRAYRRHHLSGQLIAGAVDHARKQGGTMLEAYPVDPDSPSYSHMGYVSAFKKAGFDEIFMAGKRRHVMRLPLR